MKELVFQTQAKNGYILICERKRKFRLNSWRLKAINTTDKKIKAPDANFHKPYINLYITLQQDVMSYLPCIFIEDGQSSL